MKQSIIPPNVVFYLGLAAFALGITSVTVPEFTMETIIIIIGIIISLGGIITMILRLRNKSENKFLQVLQLVGSSLNIIFGAVLIIIPDVFLEIFIIVLGASLILAGIAQLILTLGFTPISNTGKMFVGLSMVMVIAGTVFIFNPFESAEAITRFFGIIVSVYGLTNIMMSFWIRSEISKNKQTQKIDIKEFPTDTNDIGESAGDD
jgi:uncharacterized membrane protein HdeD (DUF308 family)